MTSKRQIFVSHSKDDPNLQFFKDIISAVSLKGFWMEYEDFNVTPWAVIRKEMIESSCVIVALSRLLLDYGYGHTRNWISFEVGLACAMGKDLWVFEPWDEPIDFPVPYCSRYALYTPGNIDHIKHFIGVFEEYIEHEQIPHMGVGLQQCTKESCMLPFVLMSDAESFRCPACRTPLEKEVTSKKGKRLVADLITKIVIEYSKRKKTGQ